MNQHISLRRLQLLFRVFIAERAKTYLSSLGLIVIISLLLMLPILFTKSYDDILYVLHAFALFGPVMLGGSLFTSTAFSQYHNHDKGMATIMLPASQLEKFMIILVAHIIFMVSTLLVFWNLHLLITEAANAGIPEDARRRYNIIPSDVLEYLVFLYFLFQGIIFLCSIYFRKQVFIKALIVILVTGTAALLLHLGLAYQLTGATSQINSLPFMPWSIIQNGRQYVAAFPDAVYTGIRVLLAFVIIALMLTAYVRLREKEI